METIEYGCNDGVATITLNRPESKNAINATMSTELDAVLTGITRDPSVRAVVLAGAGGAFCAGGDVRAMNSQDRTAETWNAHLRRSHLVVRALHALDRPVIAAVDGVAFGAGFSLSLLADIVLASSRARFCMAFGRIGLVPDYGALYTLPRAVGMQRARELFYSAREVGAEEARALGIALEVLEPEALLPRAYAMARAFAAASPVAIGLTKGAINSSFENGLDDVLRQEAAAQGIAGTSAYAKESFRRFGEKQPTRFQWPAIEAAR